MQSDFCWGILFHLLGFSNDSQTKLKRLKDPRTSKELAKAIRGFEAYQKSVGFIESISPLPEDYYSFLSDIVEKTSSLLTGDGRKNFSSDECDRLPRIRTFGQAQDGHNGYSRDSFKRIGKERFRKDIAAAAVLYLLRGHALFFSRSKSQRDYNAAMVSLNDFYQASQMAWRLYHELSLGQQYNLGQIQNDYYADIISQEPGSSPPEQSAYYIWNLLLIVDVFRGNIFRQIHFLNVADRHYRNVETQFNRLADYWEKEEKPISFSKRWFVPPTLVRAFYEHSKVEFDLGYILESLRTQTDCLHWLIENQDRMTPSSIKQRIPLVKVLAEISNYLNTQQIQPIFDRALVTACFGDKPPELQKAWIKNEFIKSFEPAELIQLLDDGDAPFVASILSSMGFTLYTLCRRGMRGPTKKQMRWLDCYCRFDVIWNKNKERQIKQSRLGTYCQTLYDPNPPLGDTDVFINDIERRFALQLRQSPVMQNPPGNSLNESDFYRAILMSATQNIGNLVTIPRRNYQMMMRRGYKHRRLCGDLSAKSVPQGLGRAKTEASLPSEKDLLRLNKLTILRRWQSFNPRIPRPEGISIRGGGYFLIWHGKGIVIDPGFEFIQSFYDEGFSLEDIDAIVVTHSHPDHDADLSTLLTLVKEWNDFHERTGQKFLVKRWDLLLNESSHKKYSSWLQSSAVRFGRIIPLPVLRWDKDTTDWNEGPVRGENVWLDLRQEYGLQIEVVPAWHDDVISKTSTVGLKFHLFAPEGKHRIGIVGITSDTGAFGIQIGNEKENNPISVASLYKNCDILIAHLGDVRLRELASSMAACGAPWYSIKENPHPLIALSKDWFSKFKKKDETVDSRIFASRLRDFLSFATTLDLIPDAALKAEVPGSDGKSYQVQEWLGRYIANEGKEFVDLKGGSGLDHVLRSLTTPVDETLAVARRVQEEWMRAKKELAELGKANERDKNACLLVEFLAISSLFTWQYPYHLGIFGIHKVFREMVKYHRRNDKKKGRLLIIGEVPEELTSYRHVIACWLNKIKGNDVNPKSGKRPVNAFTGDIGLHISFGNGADPIVPKMRCAFCNYNNEIVCRGDNYHEPNKIRELPIKRQQSSMIYLCTKKDHFPEGVDEPHHFLSNPDRRFH